MCKKHLNSKAHFYIEKRHSEGISIYKIAKKLGFSHSNISRELKRNTDPDFAIYNNLRAVIIMDERDKNSRKPKFCMINGELKQHIIDRILLHTSPELLPH